MTGSIITQTYQRFLSASRQAILMFTAICLALMTVLGAASLAPHSSLAAPASYKIAWSHLNANHEAYQGALAPQISSEGDSLAEVTLAATQQINNTLLVDINVEVPEDTTRLTSQVKLLDTDGTTIARSQDRWNDPEAGEHAIRASLAPQNAAYNSRNPRELSPGIYTVETRVTLNSLKGKREQTLVYKTYLHDTTLRLDGGILINVSLPPLMYPLDQQVAVAGDTHNVATQAGQNEGQTQDQMQGDPQTQDAQTKQLSAESAAGSQGATSDQIATDQAPANDQHNSDAPNDANQAAANDQSALLKRSDRIAHQLDLLLETTGPELHNPITLVFSQVTLRDWQALSQTDELYRNLLAKMQQKVESGKLKVISSGESYPDLDLLQSLGAINEAKAMLLPDKETAFDDRPLPELSVEPGLLLAAHQLSRPLSYELEAKEVPLIILPQTQDAPQKFLQVNAKTNAVLYSESLSKMLTSQSNDVFIEAFAAEHSLLIASAQATESVHDVPMVLVAQLTGDEEAFGNLRKNIQFLSKVSLVQLKFADKIADQKTEVQLDLIDPTSNTKQQPSQTTSTNGLDTAATSSSDEPSNAETQAIKEAHKKLLILADASSPLSTQVKTAWQYFVSASSAQWQALNEPQGAEEQARAVTDLVQNIFDSITITSPGSKLNSNTASIPAVIKNVNDIALTLTITAHGSGQVKVNDQKYIEGVTASTKAGDNYLQIPIKIDSGPAGGNPDKNALTIEVRAKNEIVKTQVIPIESSRVDLKLIFIGGILLFLLIIIMMRRRLRAAGASRALNQEALTEDTPVIQDIIETLGDNEHTHSDASEATSGHNEHHHFDLEKLHKELCELEERGTFNEMPSEHANADSDRDAAADGSPDASRVGANTPADTPDK